MKEYDSKNKKKSIPKHLSRLGAWSVLLTTLFSVWLFAAYIGPWLEGYIPMMDEIVKVVEEQDINANAYFYTEIEAGFDGERYLRESFQSSGREDYGLTIPFISGIVLCLLILGIGYRYMPT